LVTGFVDDSVNHVLGLDPEREAALELVGIGGHGVPATDDVPPPAIALETMPLSSREVDYPLLREAMAASRLATADDVSRWRQASAPPRAKLLAASPLPAPPSALGRTLSDTIQRRGSTRRFSHAPLTAEELATTLWAATRPIAADVPSGLVMPFVIVNAVDG